MKRFLPLLLSINLLLFYGSAQGQSFVIEEDTLSVTIDTDDSETVAYGKIVNSNNQPVDIVWERVVNNYASSWNGTQICDKNKCFNYPVSSKSFQLAAGDTGNIDVHFVNNGETGNGYVKVKVYVDRDSAATANFMHFYAKEPLASSIDREQEVRDPAAFLSIYPNPVRDYLLVKNKGNLDVRKVEVYNILGSKALTHRAEPNAIINRINMQDLEKGIYLIRVYGKDNQVLMTQSVSKSKY